MTAFTTVATPLGPLHVAAHGGAVVALTLASPDPAWRRDDEAPSLAEARAQLSEFFAGERRAFDLPLALGGTPWQRRVWDAVAAIPFGETRTYASVAASLGRPGASRAVGHANGRNPACIVVPCHRVVGSDGSLTGYAYGLDAKRALLELEGASL
jgi:methylated-DNA-[protein]-cysteine S-methyltransferase